MWAVFSTSNSHALQKRPMTFEDVLAIKSITDAQASPDGKWVAYVVTATNLKDNDSNSDVWLVSTSGDGHAIRLTTAKKGDNQPRWSPDSQRIAFVSDRDDKSQIFLISPFGGEAEKLTDSKTAVQSFQWSPDGRRIAFVASRELTAEEEKREKEKDDAQVIDKNHRYSSLWIIDLESKKTAELVKTDDVPSDPQWSPDGRSIAYVTVPTPKADDGGLADIWIVDVSSGSRRKLIENEGPDNAPRWSPDGRSIAFRTRDTEKGLLGQLKLAVVPASGGEPRLIANSFEYQPGPVSWSPDGRTLLFTAPVRTTAQLFSVPVAAGDAKQMSRLPGVMGQATFSRDLSIAAFTKSDLQTPNDVYISRGTPVTEAIKLTDHNPQVRGFQLGKGEVIRWKSKDGIEIEGVLIYPVDYQAGKRYPLVAQIHGGPSGVWTGSFPASWVNYGQVWAGKGWVCFYPNVRGSSGYGEKFQLSNIRDWGGGDYQDVQTGIDHLIAKGIADPERLGQTGWSYGGYMTAWTLTQTNRFKALMAGAGLTNMFSMYSTNDLQRVLEGYFGAEPWDDLEAYRRASAMTFIKKAKTPTLILHGAEDKRVPVGQAQELYMGLRKNGVAAELVFYPREGHGLREPRHQLDKMRREYAWFSRHVLGVDNQAP
jgi:dipeptidyl aminopeptidase/acylaminoacyl peptidase